MIKPYLHKNLADGKWFTLSYAQQLGNIGSEYYRAIKAKQSNNDLKYDLSCDLAMELVELTLDDKRWYGTPKLKELCRMKEEVARTLFDEKQPDPNLQNYFDGFAVYARNNR